MLLCLKTFPLLVFAVVFRDANGVFLTSCTTLISGVPLVRECDAFALRDAILGAIEISFQQVIFETDSKLVADVIHSSHEDLSEFGDIISRCHTLLHQHDSYSIRFVKKQANEVAHALAKELRFSPCPSFHYDLPSYLIPVMNVLCPIEAH